MNNFIFKFNDESPILLGDISHLSREEWLEWRKHGPNYKNDPNNPVPYIPFTVGGSDVAIVYGESPWTSNVQLWGEKMGRLQPVFKENPTTLKLGHYMEPFLREEFETKTGFKVEAGDRMFQHPYYPWALAEPDAFYYDASGERCILEIKTTNYRCESHWSNDQIPSYYEMQIRFYMAVCNIHHGAFICRWGTGEDNYAIRYVERDEAKEEDMFRHLSEFIESLEKGEVPAPASANPDDALKALTSLFKPSASAEVELSARKYGILLEKFLRFAEQKKAAEKEAEKFETEMKKIQSEIFAGLEGHTTASCTVPGKGAFVVVAKPQERTSVDSAKLKKEFPEVYARVTKKTVVRPLKVKIVDGKGGAT